MSAGTAEGRGLTGLWLGIALIGCAQTPPPPTPPRGTIYVKGMFTMTGPTSDVSVSYSKAILDSVRATNADGGIRGYAIDLDWVDYQYDVAKAVSVYDAWKTDAGWSKVSTIFGWGTGDTLQLSARATADQKPYISASYAGSLTSPQPIDKSVTIGPGQTRDVKNAGAPYNFFAGADYSTSIRLGMEFARSKNAKKVAFAYCNQGYCTDPIPAGKAYAISLGLAVGNDVGGPQLSDNAQVIDALFAAYFASPENQDVDWIWIGNSTGTARPAIQAIKKYHPTTKVISNIWGFDENLYSACAVDGPPNNPCVNDVYGVMSFAAYGDTRFPGMEALTALHDSGRLADGEDKQRYQDVRYVQGYVSFFIWRKAVEGLADSNTEVTGPNLKAALEKFSRVDTGGLTDPISFSPTDHRPQNSARFYSINNLGKLQYEGVSSIELTTDWLGW